MSAADRGEESDDAASNRNTFAREERHLECFFDLPLVYGVVDLDRTQGGKRRIIWSHGWTSIAEHKGFSSGS